MLFIAYLTIFGGLLSAAVLFYRKFVPVSAEVVPGWAAKLHVQGTGIPYGIAIAASGLLMYPQTILYLALAGLRFSDHRHGKFKRAHRKDAPDLRCRAVNRLLGANASIKLFQNMVAILKQRLT